MSAVLRVVRGNPTAEELGAVVALLAARSAAAPEPPAPTRPLWAVPQLRVPLVPGAGAWRASAFRA